MDTKSQGMCLIGKAEEDVGAAASRQHLQERTGAASQDRVGARRAWLVGCVEEGKESSSWCS